MAETRGLSQSIEKSKELSWLIKLMKEIWYGLLTFEKMEINDLKFLIQLEQEGYQGSLNFFKYSKK